MFVICAWTALFDRGSQQGPSQRAKKAVREGPFAHEFALYRGIAKLHNSWLLQSWARSGTISGERTGSDSALVGDAVSSPPLFVALRLRTARKKKRCHRKAVPSGQCDRHPSLRREGLGAPNLCDCTYLVKNIDRSNHRLVHPCFEIREERRIFSEVVLGPLFYG